MHPVVVLENYISQYVAKRASAQEVFYSTLAHGYYSKHHHVHHFGDDDDSSDDESSGHGYRRYSYDYDVHHHDHYDDGNPFDDEAYEVEYER